MSERVRRIRVLIAWVFLIGSIIGWPLSATTFARDEPQFILGLSWLAIIIECGTLLTASQVHRDQGDSDS